MTASDENWTVVVGNLRKSRKSWSHLSRIMGRERTSNSVSGIFFNTVVHAVLFFGVETWVVKLLIGRALGGVPTKGRETDHGEIDISASGWDLVLTSAGYGNSGSRIRKYGRVCAKEAEYGYTIHHNVTNYGPLQGDGADARDVGKKKVMGTGGLKPCRSKDRDSGRKIREVR